MKSPKTMRKLTIITSFVKIIITVVNSLQALYSFKHQSNSNQDDISSTGNMIKHFLFKIGEKYTLQKKSKTPSEPPKSQDGVINEVMEIMN